MHLIPRLSGVSVDGENPGIGAAPDLRGGVGAVLQLGRGAHHRRRDPTPWAPTCVLNTTIKRSALSILTPNPSPSSCAPSQTQSDCCHVGAQFKIERANVAIYLNTPPPNNNITIQSGFFFVGTLGFQSTPPIQLHWILNGSIFPPDRYTDGCGVRVCCSFFICVFVSCLFKREAGERI